MIHIKHLSKKYGHLRVLSDINLSFSEGETVALIGPNGSGKTTLIKCILGMVKPDEGEIYLNDKMILNQSDYRKQMGYMPQISRMPENLKVDQLISMIKNLREHKTDYDEILFQQFNLQGSSEKRFGSLSGGTKQKVSALLAFLFNPTVLILDEPTAGLDPVSTEFLKLKIQQAHNLNKTILITTHHMTEVQELAHRVVYIVDGKILFDHKTQDLHQMSGEENLNKAVAKMLMS